MNNVKVSTRIVPFRTQGTREPMFTIVCEHTDSGKVVWEERRMMDVEQFRGLAMSVSEAMIDLNAGDE